MKYDTATPYVAAYVIMRRGEQVAFVLRSQTTWMNGYYGLVSGKVEKGETYTQAAIREAKEEAGVEVAATDLKYLLTMHRREPEMDWVDVFFEATKWSGEPYNAEPELHSELAWLDITKLPKNVIPDIRFALAEIEKGKTYTEYGWGNQA